MNFEPLLYFNQSSPFLSAASHVPHDPRVLLYLPNVTFKTVMTSLLCLAIPKTNMRLSHLSMQPSNSSP
jgi:hypothetical protein